jgi:mono/diheme cytochrome c family protein
MECALAFSQPACRRLLASRVVLAGSAMVILSWAFGRPAKAADEVAADHPQQMAASLELFKTDVRAVLSEHCVQCHGGKETHGEFDLTTREGLMKGGELGPAVVVGKPDESLLVKLIRHLDEPNMPQDADKLPDAAIDKIAAWIASGAAYDKPLVDVAADFIQKTVTDADRQFWSFRPLAKVDVPQVRDAAWCRTSVDQFVLARLEAEKLKPSALADRRKLIRRAYLDLLGLPPEPQEVDAFLADPASDAYDRLVDRLLASPHYGERWGRHWLDLARFAESHGYEQDDDRPTAYHYRDFVIRALNDDMPFDRFVRWQIAGDELEPDNNLALMATGFLAAGTHATQITANQVEKERYDELDDMTATLGTAMLGLTVGCARCHDHKFDPIPQADYYRLVSTFTTAVRSEVDLDFHPEVYAGKKAEFDQAHVPLVESLKKFEDEQLASRFEAWLGDAKSVMPTWLILEPESTKSDGGAKFEKQEDGSFVAGGNNASHDVYTFVVPTKIDGITAVRLEAMADESLPKHGPGRADNGNFALSDFQLWAAPAGTAGPGAPIKLVNPKVTYEQKGLPIAAAIDDNQKSAWAVDGKIGENHAASFALEPALKNPQASTLTFILKFENNTGHNLGRLRLSLSTVTEAARPDATDEAQQAEVDKINAALAKTPSERTADERAVLLAWYHPRDPEWQKLSSAVAEHQKQHPKPELTKVMITSEGLPPVRLRSQGADFFKETFFLKRGDLNQKLTAADQSFLQVLMNVPDGAKHWQQAPPEGWRTSYRRRALASWITDVDRGAGSLLARVAANRLWQHHLGRGIVATPSDFGAAGERPTHPELLDYLAKELIASGWKLKTLHKLIMTSAVYMQSSESDDARAAADPDNRLVWRRARQRLEAEAIRDAMLAAAGILDTSMYGPGSLDESSNRRSIYFTVKRSQLIPAMMLYDAPDALTPLGQRAATIVAPQALAMLNSKQVQACSAAFAERLSADASAAPAESVKRGFEIALSRPPDDAELADAVDFIRRATERYQAAGNERPARQALTDFCQVLLGLNEFIYVD